LREAGGLVFDDQDDAKGGHGNRQNYWACDSIDWSSRDTVLKIKRNLGRIEFDLSAGYGRGAGVFA
jgi:hypothetical protein